MNDAKGLYGKYRITKEDGSPVSGFRFVLAPEKDPAALKALMRYAETTTNKELEADLRRIIFNIMIFDDANGADSE